jgi:hypothetical protein
MNLRDARHADILHFLRFIYYMFLLFVLFLVYQRHPACCACRSVYILLVAFLNKNSRVGKLTTQNIIQACLSEQLHKELFGMGYCEDSKKGTYLTPIMHRCSDGLKLADANKKSLPM